jgi:hypothetical protein
MHRLQDLRRRTRTTPTTARSNTQAPRTTRITGSTPSPGLSTPPETTSDCSELSGADPSTESATEMVEAFDRTLSVPDDEPLADASELSSSDVTSMVDVDDAEETAEDEEAEEVADDCTTDPELPDDADEVAGFDGTGLPTMVKLRKTGRVSPV